MSRPVPSGQEDSPIAPTGSPTDAGAGQVTGPMADESLLTMMDRAVEGFARIMVDSSFTESGEGASYRKIPTYSFTEKMKAAEFCRDWLMRRKKIDTDEGKGEAADMAPEFQKMMSQVKKITEQTVVEQMRKKGVLTMPKRGPGRPTNNGRKAFAKATAKVIQERDRGMVVGGVEDDGELQRMLGDG